MYFISMVLVYLILGINFFILDKKYGVKFYNFIAKISSENIELFENNYEKGFIYNQTKKQKMVVATITSFVLSFIVIYTGHVSLPVELAMFFIEIPIMYTGFLLGPIQLKLLNKINIFLNDTKQEEKETTQEEEKDKTTQEENFADKNSSYKNASDEMNKILKRN